MATDLRASPIVLHISILYNVVLIYSVLDTHSKNVIDQSQASP
jgi:hypothetical protein